MADLDIGSATADDFAPLRNQEFRLRAPMGDAILILSEVRRLGQALRADGAFSLLFVARGAPALPQATYEVSHAALGTLEIFLVPVGPVSGGAGYEAVFT